jgi:hypothetical protein
VKVIISEKAGFQRTRRRKLTLEVSFLFLQIVSSLGGSSYAVFWVEFSSFFFIKALGGCNFPPVKEGSSRSSMILSSRFPFEKRHKIFKI